jgi:hypothetical protein
LADTLLGYSSSPPLHSEKYIIFHILSKQFGKLFLYLVHKYFRIRCVNNTLHLNIIIIIIIIIIIVLWEDNIKMDLHEVGWGSWTVFVWFRIGTGCGNF